MTKPTTSHLIHFLVSSSLLFMTQTLGFSVQPPKHHTTARTTRIHQSMTWEDYYTTSTPTLATTTVNDDITSTSTFAATTVNDDIDFDVDVVPLAGRYFQLEEMEDAETRMTGIWLHSNNTVTAVISDIPCFKSAIGTWERNTLDNSFSMSLTSTFKVGRKAHLETDMGEFEFSMERFYNGEIDRIGTTASINGAIHIMDEMFGDEKVGYYSMIDTQLDPTTEDAGPVFTTTTNNGGFAGAGMTSKSMSF